ncbi:MAG: hypothetical protein IPG23_24860 [Burkholderiales bacterium]|nr:hypothetical protein [Burkholderiales bacterium]
MNLGGSFTNTASATVRVGLGNATTIGVLGSRWYGQSGRDTGCSLDWRFRTAASDIFGVITYANRTGSFSSLLGESPGSQVTFSVDTASSPTTLKVKSFVLTTIVPGIDLVVTGLGLATGAVLQSGNTINVVWQDSNTGTLPTVSSWSDRVVVKRIDTGAVLADFLVPYDAVASGPIAGGASFARQASFTLPQGNLGAGNLNITVTADSANTVTEINTQGLAEVNNSTSINVTSALAPYPDLIVTNVTPTPALGWLPGDPVVVTWKTFNQGTGSTSGSWTETVRVRNLTTGQTLLTQNVAYDATVLGDITAGGLNNRSATLTWPTGFTNDGQIEFTVTTDSASQLFENNLTNTAESNNAGVTTVVSAPDLTVSNLTSDTSAPKTGDLITLNWNDINNGNTAVKAGWYDRIKVTNQSTGQMLVDQQLRFDPPPGDTLQVGASASRSYSFRLADGNAGAGNLLIQITTDQNTSGVGSVVEANAAGTGDTNNGANLSLTSTLAPYPDLQISSLAVSPAVGWQPADTVTVSWKTRNWSTGPTSGSWTETLRVRNLTTGQTLFTQNLSYDASVLGDIAVADLRDRSTTLLWPTGANANGQFEFTVTTDAVSQVFENNLPGTAESNNASQIVILSAPDLVVGNLTSDTPAPMTGDLITLNWNDINNGNTAVNAGWYDRIKVTNQSTGAVLLDQQLRYDLPPGGLLQPGSSTARNYSFHLTDGNAGVGNLLIQIIADQSTAGTGSSCRGERHRNRRKPTTAPA